MRNLTRQEIESIHAGAYEEWAVITIAGLSSGFAFGVFEAFESLSLTAGLKFFAACSIPTAFVSAIIVGGIGLVQWEEKSA
ncbi:MAG: hypothetical protein BGO43_10775 [Gammaproteobacteria bacterium 39-13]|nr:hypothetical protein [Gammaproteobacteria bacterium]OJV86174.1 MAG: hypothetical protein BGO43_10775 [Gammaproteobacteria bacterium 39-13]